MSTLLLGLLVVVAVVFAIIILAGLMWADTEQVESCFDDEDWGKE